MPYHTATLSVIFTIDPRDSVFKPLCVLPATAYSGGVTWQGRPQQSLRNEKSQLVSSQLMKMMKLWSSLQLMKVHSLYLSEVQTLVVVTSYITKVGQLRLKYIICSFICGVRDEHQIEVLASKALWSTRRKSGLRNRRWGFLCSYWRSWSRYITSGYLSFPCLWIKINNAVCHGRYEDQIRWQLLKCFRSKKMSSLDERSFLGFKIFNYFPFPCSDCFSVLYSAESLE